MLVVNFLEKEMEKTVKGLTQWDYGQKLEIHGLDLPDIVEIHFSIYSYEDESTRRIGHTVNKVTTVAVPERILEQPRDAVAYIYVSDEESGKTVRTIHLPIDPRNKPEDYITPDDPLKDNPLRDAVNEVRNYYEKTESLEKSAEAWTHGHEEYPDRAEDNAKYYSDQARTLYEQSVKNITDKGTEQVDAVNAAGQQAVLNIGTGIDSSLTQSGKAADAKETGDKIRKIEEDAVNFYIVNADAGKTFKGVIKVSAGKPIFEYDEVE